MTKKQLKRRLNTAKSYILKYTKNKLQYYV